jgi:AcrR family transcriptional regulator
MAISRPDGQALQTSAGTSQERARIRAGILEAARSVISDAQYESWSIEDVARAAGCSRRTIHSRFESKYDLYRASREEIVDALFDVANFVIPERMDLADGIIFFVYSAYEACADPKYCEILISSVRDYDSHPWLIERYMKMIRSPMTIACENFVLSKLPKERAMRTSFALIADQIFQLVESVAIGTIVANGTKAPRRSQAADPFRLELVARSYAALLADKKSLAALASSHHPKSALDAIQAMEEA